MLLPVSIGDQKLVICDGSACGRMWL